MRQRYMVQAPSSWTRHDRNEDNVILCYQLDTGSDACGLARGTKPLHIEGVSHMTTDLVYVTCGVCLAAIEMMVI